jgi:uncharacterized protein (TIGR04255 family)
VQVRRDGFTFSLLSPYTSWNDLRTKTIAAWSRYVELAAPTGVRRLGLRYINRLTLPAADLRLEDWFRLHPVAPDVFGPLSDLLLRLAVHHPDDADYVALATLGSTPAESPETITFVLDVDTWVQRQLPADEALWGLLDDLHEFKNDVFFGSLTPATLERIRQ